MMARRGVTALVACLVLSMPPQGARSQDNPVYAQAEALLADSALADARALLENHLKSHTTDARALTLLGRVHLDWPVVGRWRALQLLRLAAEYAPDDPEPWYWKIRVGKFLGSADGEALMRSGIYGVLRRDPDYRDVWKYWEEIYHNPSRLREVAAILAAHASHPSADLRRAQLLTEAEEYASADSLLSALVARGRDDGGVWAVRAQAALEVGDVDSGLAFYERALARAASDSLNLLWRQVAPIAWPYEDSLWNATVPEDRGAFFRAFWARREPDLTTEPNERVLEHFARLRHARANYRLLHPQAGFHHSIERRTVLSSQSGRVLDALLDFGPPGGIIPGRSRLEDEIQRAGVGVDLRDLPEPDSVSRYRRYGFDGRGLLYLRFGEPDQRLINHFADVEAWDYDVGGVRGRLVFARATADGGGDMILFPTSRAEVHNAAVMLEQDATSLAADLQVVAWVAFFRGALEGEQLVYVGVNADTSAAAVWDDHWREAQRTYGTAPHVLVLDRGAYTLGIDTRQGDRRGRLRAEIEVPTFWRGSLALSSLLLGVVGDTAFTRDQVAAAMPPDRQFPAGASLALYSEVYGLSVDRDGRSRYGVTYAFEPSSGGRLLSLSFSRVVSGADVVPERVVIQPDRLPPGRYRLRVTVEDQVRRRFFQSTSVMLEVR